MRQEIIEVYQFDELTPEAQATAIEQVRQRIDTSYIWSEAENTVDAFHKIFPTEVGHRSWLNWRFAGDEDIEVTGLRLRKYIINNYWDELMKGKYYSLWSKKDFPFNPHHNKPFPELKKRYSKVIKTFDCPLTGVCYDHDLLQPIEEFVLKYSHAEHGKMTFDKLIDNCFKSLEKAIVSEEEYRQSDEGVKEDIEGNDYEFTKSGAIW